MTADQTAGGEIYCSHVATWVALSPVPQATGFAVVPGSVCALCVDASFMLYLSIAHLSFGAHE